MLSFSFAFLQFLSSFFGRDARGRPSLGWMDGVKRALRERGINVTEAKERARNRNEWRAIVGQ